MRLAIFAVLFAGAFANKYPQCFDSFQCRYHQVIGDSKKQFSWDLSPLCRPEGHEYKHMSGGHEFIFNICGSISQHCAPKYEDSSHSAYTARGLATQFHDEVPPAAEDCEDADNPGQTLPCTRTCRVIAQTPPTYNLIDPEDPYSGISIWFDGMPSTQKDPFPCPNDKRTGLPRERTFAPTIYCDRNVNGLQIDRIEEGTEETDDLCVYYLYASSKYACGIPGNPFIPYRNRPSDSFGFVVLGVVLTLFVSWMYRLGDRRGLWDPIKAKIPDSCANACGMQVGGLYGRGAGYTKTGSANASTPITASAYGSA